MNTDFFDKIEEYFNQNLKKLESIVKKSISKSVKQVATKGVMYSVEPFESEFQYGKRTSKKVLPEVVPKDDCYRVYIDDKERVIAVDRASEFLSKPNEIYIKTEKIFIYEDDTVWALHVADWGIVIKMLLFDNQKLMEEYSCDFNSTYNDVKPYLLSSYSYNKYIWQDEKLISKKWQLFRIDKKDKSKNKLINWKLYSELTEYNYELTYDQKGKLISILEEHDGRTEFMFTSIKPKPFDFEKLYQDLLVATVYMYKNYREIVKKGTMCGFGLYTDEEGSFLSFAINTKEHLDEVCKSDEEMSCYKYSTSEWMHEGVEINGALTDISNRLCEYLNSLPTDSYKDKFRTNVLNQSVKVLESFRKTEDVAKEITLMVNITTDELNEYERARIIKKLN